MGSDWKTAFARFLVDRGAVPASDIDSYVRWVDRLLAAAPPDGDPLRPLIVSRYLTRLRREREPWQVQQAEVAVRHYGFFRDQFKAAAGEWDVLEREMRRVLRLQHRCLRTENSYLGW